MKKFSIGLVAILMAIGFAAFTTPHKTKSMPYLYQFTGSTLSDEQYKANYIEAETPEGCNDEVQERVCFIESNYAPDATTHQPQFPSEPLDVRNTPLDVTVDHWKPEP